MAGPQWWLSIVLATLSSSSQFGPHLQLHNVVYSKLSGTNKLDQPTVTGV